MLAGAAMNASVGGDEGIGLEQEVIETSFDLSEQSVP